MSRIFRVRGSIWVSINAMEFIFGLSIFKGSSWLKFQLVLALCLVGIKTVRAGQLLIKKSAHAVVYALGI